MKSKYVSSPGSRLAHKRIGSNFVGRHMAPINRLNEVKVKLEALDRLSRQYPTTD